MNRSKVMFPAVVAGILLAAMVVAAPRGFGTGTAGAEAPNRADAYKLASAD